MRELYSKKYKFLQNYKMLKIKQLQILNNCVANYKMQPIWVTKQYLNFFPLKFNQVLYKIMIAKRLN